MTTASGWICLQTKPTKKIGLGKPITIIITCLKNIVEIESCNDF